MISRISLVRILRRSPLVREYQRAFKSLTGLPVMLRDVGSWQLAHRNRGHKNAFCALMLQGCRTSAECLRLQKEICSGANGSPCPNRCAFGLYETAVAVKVGPQTVAHLITGQVFLTRPTMRQVGCAISRVRRWSSNIGMNEAYRSCCETPVASRARYLAAGRLLQIFADHLSELANRIILRGRDAEPAHIAFARQFVEQHHRGKLSLTDVARRIGITPEYLCSQFQKVTGTKFTQYVSCVRIETAKRLLLNSNHSLKEIASESGFGSLRQFTRAFHEITGQTPMAYRHHVCQSGQSTIGMNR